MKLYFSPGACSLSPHIVAREAGLDVTAVKVDMRGKKTDVGDDYLAINEKGQVPALGLDDGSVLTEGVAIVQYLADKKPESKLAPANGTMERYRLQEWLNFVSTELHKGFSPLFNPATSDEQKAATKATLAKKFAYLEKHLAGKPYLTGDTFTVADAYLFTILGWAAFTHVDLSPFPTLVAYQARVAARPAVQAALRAEGLIKA